jgi:hypothetical protein
MRMSRQIAVGLLAFVVSSGFAANVSAQFLADLVKSAGVGATVGVVAPLDSEVDVGPVYGVTIGLAPVKGWSWAGNLGWFTGDLLLEDGGVIRDVGQITVRPLMGGVGYTWVYGKLFTTVSFTAGISVNSADVDEDYRQIFGSGTSVSLDADNSFCMKPAVEVEYALTPKWALTTYGGFLFTSIDSRLRTPVGTYEDQWDASHFSVHAGIMFYPFRR